MALIKCPECKKNMSDKADACPHCGYQVKESKVSGGLEKLKSNPNTKYILVVLVALVVIILFGVFDKKENNNPTNPNEPSNNEPQMNNGNYVYNYGGLYFEFPTTYKAYVDKNKTIYVGKNIDDNGALIPYVMVDKYKGYTEPVKVLEDFDSMFKKEYPDTVIMIDKITGILGDKNVVGSMYGYTSSGHVVIDNRYAFLVNNSMYVVSSREENQNTTEINNVVDLVIKSLKEVK